MELKTGLTSVTFRDKSIDEIITLAKQNNLSCIEWGGDIHAPVGNIDLATQISEKCAENDISIPSYGSYYKCINKEDFDEVLLTAKALGVSIIRVWAGVKSPDDITSEEFNSLVDNLSYACNESIKHGIKIALEYHRGTLTQTKESTLNLLNHVKSDNLFLYWQPNPDISFDEQLSEIIALKDYIITYHVFAWSKDNTTTTKHLLCEFVEKWKEYISLSPNINYLLEFVKDDSVEHFISDAKTLNEIVSAKVSSCDSCTNITNRRKNAVFICGESFAFDIYDSKSLAKLDTMFKLPRLVITKENYKNHLELLKKAEYVFSSWGMIDFTEDEVSEYMPNLKAVFYGAGSVQYFARAYLNKSIRVFSSWSANAIPVAEYTTAQITLATKGYFQNVRRYRKHDREVASNYFHEQKGNYNVKIGILGGGMIGKKVMSMLQSYCVDVLVCDPFLSFDEAKKYNATKVDMNTLFSECLVISNHTANLPDTIGLFTYEQFKLMQKNATFINTGRPAQIVEKDLIRVLSEREDITALLDVEVPPKGNPLLELDNVFLTTHIAGSSGNELARMGEYMVNEAQKFLLNEYCEYEVSLKMLETMA